MKLLLLIVMFSITGCQVFSSYTPAERRCIAAGLKPIKMRISEDINKAQEVIVDCTKKPVEIPEIKEIIDEPS